MDSPLHTSLVKRHRHRVLLSSDEKDTFGQPDEVIPSRCADQASSTSSSVTTSEGIAKQASPPKIDEPYPPARQAGFAELLRWSALPSQGLALTEQAGPHAQPKEPRHSQGEANSELQQSVNIATESPQIITTQEEHEVIINMVHSAQDA